VCIDVVAVSVNTVVVHEDEGSSDPLFRSKATADTAARARRRDETDRPEIPVRAGSIGDTERFKRGYTVTVTSKELARICGVSIGTVDRALNDRPGISPKTKEKILRVSREIGYRPHLIARSLKTGKTMTLGIVVFDLDNQYFSQLIDALEKRLRTSGYFLHLTLSDHDQEREIACLEHLASLRVDGIFLVATNAGTQFSSFLKSLNVPIVTLGNRVSKTIPFVGIDDRAALGEVVDYVVSEGYREVVYYSPPLSYHGRENIYAVAERLAGYKESIDKHHLRQVVIKEKNDFRLLVELLRSSSDRTAVVCSSDIFALQTLRYLSAEGFRVPEDVGLMGFDDIDLLEYVSPPLTTVSQRTGDLVDLAVNLMTRLLANEVPVPPVTTIKAAIVKRQSI